MTDTIEQTPLGGRIEARRTELRLSLRELGRRSGVDHTAISKIVRGVRTDPHFETLEKIAKGLDMTTGELVGSSSGEAVLDPNGVVPLRVDALIISPLNPRKHTDEETIVDLALSIARQGVLQNLTVRRLPPGEPSAASSITQRYEVVIGGRRLMAARRNMREHVWPADAAIPCRIVEVDDLEALTMATAENIARETMHPLEEADAFVAIQDRGVETADIAEAIGRSQRFVQERIRIGRGLAKPAREAFFGGRMTMDQVRELARAPEAAQQAVIAKAKSLIGQGDHKTRKVDFHDVPLHRFKQELRNPFPRASDALFDIARYDGPMIESQAPDETEDPQERKDFRWDSPYGRADEDDQRFADVERFKELQQEAIEKKKDELLWDKAVKWVDLVESDEAIGYYRSAPGPYVATARESDGSGRGAVILIYAATLAVRVFEKCYRQGGGGAKRAKTAKGEEAPSGPVDPIEGIRTGRRHYAKRARTTALRWIVLKHPEMAKAFLIIRLLGGMPWGSGLQITRENIAADDRVDLPDEVVNVLRTLADYLPNPLAVIEKDIQLGDGYHFTGADAQAWELEAFKKLMATDLPLELDEVLAALIARQMVVATSEDTLGDRPIIIEAAEFANVEMVDHWHMDEAYLETLGADDVRRLAVKTQVNMTPPEIKKAKVKDLRAAILQHLEDNSLNFVPPEIEFGDRASIEKWIREGAERADATLAAPVEEAK